MKRFFLTFLLLGFQHQSASSALVNVDGVVEANVTGLVTCTPRCSDDDVQIQIFDIGIGKNTEAPKKMHQQYVVKEDLFEFRTGEYWWSASLQEGHIYSRSAPIEIRVRSQGCVDFSRAIDLNSIEQRDGIFFIELGHIELRCSDKPEDTKSQDIHDSENS